MGQLVTRQELYNLVWSEPMVSLAKRFEISDIGLAKICKQAIVPCPGRGYWAKRDAGKKITQTPLPRRALGQRNEVQIGRHANIASNDLAEPLPLPPSFSEGLEEVTDRAKDLVGKARFIQSLSNPHHLIGQLLEDDKVRREKLLNNQYAWDKERFKGPFERRRLRILNSIFLAFARCGCKASLSGQDAREISVCVGDCWVSFSLDSKKQSRRQSNSSISVGKTEAEPLKLEIDSWQELTDITLRWEDENDKSLEGQLEEIVVGLVIAGEWRYRTQVTQKYEWVLESRRIAEEQIRLQKEEEERQKREDLLKDANTWRQACDLREYVRAAEAQAQAHGKLNGEFANWATWALTEADRIDPLYTVSAPCQVGDRYLNRE
jgi:hypothetical protein